MIIKADEHCFIAGSTGSGKTYFAKAYLRDTENQVFVLDTKGLFEWNVDKKELIIIKSLSDIFEASNQYQKIIYRPKFEELTDELYNQFFKFCYQYKNCIVVVDEAMQVCPSPYKIPEYYKGILTRGRELNVSVWSLTQRPSMIPIVIYSEATHYFIFQLVYPDKKKLSDFTGYDEFEENLKKYHFWYYNTRTNDPPVVAKLSERRGIK